MKAKSMSAISSIILLLGVLSCNQNKPEWKGIIEKNDGVIIVKNPKEPMFEGNIFTLEEELSIGETIGAEEYIFGYIWQIVVDGNENIYVIDRNGSEEHVKVFDSSGKEINSIGRQGQGPGEYNRATHLQITPNNELMVHDRYSHKLIYFSLAGKYLRTALYFGENVMGVQVNSNGNYFVFTVEFQRQKINNSYYAANKLELFGPDLNFIKLIAKDEFRNVQGVISPPWMIPKFPSSEFAICGFSENYELQIYNLDGNLVQKISKDFDPVEIDEFEKEKRNWTERKGLPKYFPAFEDFFVDEEGRIYVQTFEREMDQDKFFFDVFDPDGKYIAKIPLNTLPKYWKNGKMYTIEEDENGYLYIKRYKVTWNY